MKETKFKQTLVQTKEGSRHCEEHSDVAIQGGFKMTEVGLIPSDWEVKTLGSLTDKCSYGVGAEARVYCGDVKYIRITDIDDESHRFSPSPITSPSFFQEKHIVQKNDLLVARTGASVGKSYLYDEKDGKLVYAGFLMKLNVFNADSKYVFYNTLTKSYWNWVASESARTGQPGLNLQQMKLYSIALPPTIEEQQRIANALSDVDTLIANLEKLIAKKKNIKQGAMQQLLTGKKHLPGFTGKWSKKIISKIGFTYNGLSGKIASDFGKGSSLYVTFLNVLNNPVIDKRLFQKVNVSESENQNKVLRDDLLFNTSSEIPEEVGICSVLKTDVPNLYLNSFCFGFRLIDKTVDGLFLSYYFRSSLGRNFMSLLAQGSTRYNLSKDNFLKSSIVIPPSKAEQTAIANVLSDMDAEISALETKLAKYRTLKTGMMQQLLTGKIRLIDAKPEKASVENNRVVPVAFKRAVLAAEIAHRLCAEPTFGHVKMEKMLFLAEKMCELDINSSYHRDAAGPYDNRALRSVDSQLEKQKWFKFIRSDKGNHYIPLEKRGGHSQYFDRYYSECRSVFDNIISTFKTAKTEQCEIVATLYSAWEDFLNQGANPTDDQIVTEVLTNWNESKKRISKERWIKALLWMKENGFVPGRA